jgi:hypothetical protein
MIVKAMCAILLAGAPATSLKGFFSIKAKSGKTYELTAAKQGKYHYVYGPYADPVLTLVAVDLRRREGVRRGTDGAGDQW